MEKYIDYKESGVDWLSKIPKHWHLKRVKDLTKTISKGTTPSTEGESYTDYGVRFIKAENVNENGKVSNEPVFFISKKTNDILKRSQLKANDLLLVIAGATTGKIAIINELQLPANTNQAVCFLRLREEEKKDSLRYKYYFINSSSFQSLIWLYAVTSAQPNLPMAILGRIDFCYPPINEQTQIANYLDSKTTTIDKKIKLLQEKIKQYKAYRKTLINEAVTKGLDRNVKLKKIDINWLAEIPEHWEVMRIKDVFTISRGRAIAKTELKDNGKYPVYSSQTKNKGILGYIDTYDFNANLLTWTTDGVNAGTVFIREGKFNCTNICGTLIPKRNPKLSLDYMAFAVQESTQHNKRIDTNGAKIMSNEMAVIDIVFPPLEEQIKIANHIKSKTKSISKVLKNIEAQIATLKELRKTLINEVVTGKVKVTA